MAYVLERRQFIPRPSPEVFAFFADASNLESLTPTFLHFRILTALPIAMRAGTLIEYRLKLYGLPVYWRTRIETWEPTRGFSDLQLAGPYKYWHHTHMFEPVHGGTWMSDRVVYEVGWGPLGWLAYKLFVRRSLERIFDYRRDQIGKLLCCAPSISVSLPDCSNLPGPRGV